MTESYICDFITSRPSSFLTMHLFSEVHLDLALVSGAKKKVFASNASTESKWTPMTISQTAACKLEGLKRQLNRVRKCLTHWNFVNNNP